MADTMAASRFAIPSGGPLPDYVSPELDLLFVGINPGRRSAETGHHYAGRGNHFWPLLHESGLVPEPLSYEDDWRVPEFGIGLTNLVARASSTMDDLSLEEMREGAAGLREKILRYEPRIVCFNGKRIFEVFSGRRCRLGLQPERVGRSRLFVMPSTSARTASYQRDAKLAYFRRLRDLLRMKDE
jgi:TDG/mug DNA glycosylase family protein